MHIPRWLERNPSFPFRVFVFGKRGCLLEGIVEVCVCFTVLWRECEEEDEKDLMCDASFVSARLEKYLTDKSSSLISKETAKLSLFIRAVGGFFLCIRVVDRITKNLESKWRKKRNSSEEGRVL